MKWRWESLKQFFNFYPSEKRGVLILMSTFFVSIIFIDHFNSFFLDDSEFSSFDIIEITHYSDFDTLECLNFQESLDTSSFIGFSFSIYERDKLLKNQIKYGPYNCIDDIIDILPSKPYLISYIENVSNPEFLECPRININTASLSELKTGFRININKAKTLLKYRKSIGGFIKFEQLNKVYGFPKSKLTQFWEDRVFISKPKILKLDLSTTSYKELLKHGLISRKSASRLNKLRKKRKLTLNDIKKEVTDVNKPLVSYYFKE